MRRYRLCAVVALSVLVLTSLACGYGSSEPPGAAQPTRTPVEPGDAPTSPPLPTASPVPSVVPPGPPPPPVGATSTPAPVDPLPQVEQRIAEVEWPASMRVGDSDVVRFSLLPLPEGGYVPQPEIPEHEVEPAALPLTVERPGYTGFVIASMSAAGLDAELAGSDSQRLVAGQVNTWRWTIRPGEAGAYHVVINLVVRWEPDPESDGVAMEEAVWSHILTVEARTSLGLSGKQADWAGVVGSAVGGVAGLPFLEKVLTTLWKRIRGSNKKEGDEKTPKQQSTEK